MRWQLLFGFVLISTLVLALSWYLAVQTTFEGFQVLVSETNQQQARMLAPGLLAQYAEQGDWAGVQDELTSRLEQQRQFSEQNRQFLFDWSTPNRVMALPAAPAEGEHVRIETYPYPPEQERAQPAFDFPFIELDTGAITYHVPWQFQQPEVEAPAISLAIGGQASAEGNVYFITLDAANPRGQTIFFDEGRMSWVAGNLQLRGQRVIITDTDGRVSVDSGGDLLGKHLQPTTTADGIPLYQGDVLVGTLLVTASDGVYTVEQSAFLREVERGFLISAGIGVALSVILAFVLASRVTHPIRQLTTATAQIQRGEWGYQVAATPRRDEIGQLTAAFNSMSQHLVEQRSLRARLVDDLAHELNTPLSLMRLELQAMADGFQTPAEAAHSLTQELEEVGELVADLIFLASKDTAPARPMEPVDLNQVVGATVRRFEGSTPHQITFVPAPDLPPILGDGYLIGRAVSNLLSNALRHTPPDGRITVSTSADIDSVLVRVADSGEGIAPEHLPHLFERFYRADSSRTRGTGGRGLGLAIVKQVMEQHGGKAEVSSQPGAGSTFTLCWPLARA